MKKTTLCYVERDDCWLLLHRTKKKNDLNEGKWVGVGGKFKPGETPEQCLLREVSEETGLTLTSWTFFGKIRFLSDVWEAEEMYLYTSSSFTGTVCVCDEGDLEWVPKIHAQSLPMWEGDRIFFDRIRRGEPFEEMTLQYEGNRLVYASVNGAEIGR